MRVGLGILIWIVSHSLFGQAFSANLYFEDSQGRKDTLRIGYDFVAIDSLDAQFGEVDILGSQRDSFDVRFFAYENDFEEDLPFTCDHDLFGLNFFYEDIALYESKSDIHQSGCAVSGNIQTGSVFTIPYEASFPITIRWDKSLFIGNYGCGAGTSWISELSRGEFLQDDWCPEQINYDSISLTGLDSIILTTPSFKTISTTDSTLLTIYHIFLTDFGSLLSVSVNDIREVPFGLYPNPVQDILYLETSEQNWSYQILNLQGQQIMQGQYQDNIGVSQLPSGIYFLQLSRENELYKAIKFVKE